MTRQLSANVLFQSYIALGLEPGTSWDEVKKRHKDLIMAWHPDRFMENKQKGKAEDELKKINAARDVLDKHFQKEHSASSSCPCRFRAEPEATVQPKSDSHSSSQPQQKPSATVHPAALFKSQTAATVALVVLSFATLAAYHKLATSAAQRPNNATPAAPNQVNTVPVAPASDQPLPPGDESATEPAAETAAPGDRNQKSGEEATSTPELKKHRSGARTFLTGFSDAQEEREKQRTEARRQELTRLLERTQDLLNATNSQLAELGRKLPALDHEIESHQAVIGEITQVAGDLETPQANKQSLDAMQLYVSNPDFKKHADSLSNLGAQKQSLQLQILRLVQQKQQAQNTCLQVKQALSQLDYNP